MGRRWPGSQGVVFSKEQAQAALLQLHEAHGMSWRRIASLGQFEGCDHNVLWRFAKLGKMPPRRRDRVLLGLAGARAKRLCPRCGHSLERVCPTCRRPGKAVRRS